MPKLFWFCLHMYVILGFIFQDGKHTCSTSHTIAVNEREWLFLLSIDCTEAIWHDC